jgi:hypothetical protein
MAKASKADWLQLHHDTLATIALTASHRRQYEDAGRTFEALELELAEDALWHGLGNIELLMAKRGIRPPRVNLARRLVVYATVAWVRLSDWVWAAWTFRRPWRWNPWWWWRTHA